jgi:hypothetical protein
MPADRGTKTEIETTPVSTKMKMTLKGADFDITPLSSEEQIVGGGSPTEWEWDVVPRHAGTLRLHMAAVVELKNLSRISQPWIGISPSRSTPWVPSQSLSKQIPYGF